MARWLNRVTLVGNLGADPEITTMGNGSKVANLRVATSEVWKDKNTGEKREATEWHRLVFFGKLAEIAGQYLKKGSQIYVEGRLRTRKWQDKDGQERQTTEIVIEEMKMLGSRQGMGEPSSSYGGDSAPAPAQSFGGAKPAAAKKASFDDMDDDIPF